MVLFSVIVSAQSLRKVSGVVIDTKQMPIPSAEIAVDGMDHRAITDSKGQFTIEVPYSVDKIFISKDGFVTEKAAIDGSYIFVKLRKTNQRYRGMLEVTNAYDLWQDNTISYSLNISTTQGYQINPYLFIGAFIQYKYQPHAQTMEEEVTITGHDPFWDEYYSFTERIYHHYDMHRIDIGVDMRVYFTKSTKVKPYIGMQGGFTYSLTPDVNIGGFGYASLGLHFQLSKGIGLSVSAVSGYQVTEPLIECSMYHKEVCMPLGLKLGFEF